MDHVLGDFDSERVVPGLGVPGLIQFGDEVLILRHLLHFNFQTF